MILTKSLASPKPQGYKQHSIGARVSALALLDSGVIFAMILKQIGVSESTCHKLKKKARDRGWKSAKSPISQSVSHQSVGNQQLTDLPISL